MESMGNN